MVNLLRNFKTEMKNTSLLAIDIGNSRTNLAIFDQHELVKHDFFPSAAEYAEKVCNRAIEWKKTYFFEQIVMSSVVPALGDLLVTLLHSSLSIIPFTLEEHKTRLIPLMVDRPETVGVDRIVNSYGAIHLFGCPAIVISLGTATTFEVISEKGEYLGGAIAPGVKISMEALSQRTALLPPAILKKPERIIAKNTLEHLQSGIYYGTVSLIEGMAKRLKTIVGDRAKVIGTGGISSIIAEEGIFDHHEPLLTLKGLEIIHSHLTHTADR